MGDNYAGDSTQQCITPGTRVYAVVRRVSESGMTRWIDFYVVDNGGIRCVTGQIADVVGLNRSQKYGFAAKVGGCGMDMVWYTLYRYACKRWDNGYAWEHNYVIL